MADDDLISRLQGAVRIGFTANVDEDKSHACNQSVRSCDHGPDVNNEDLGLWGSALNPTQTGQQSFPGVMDPGSMVYYLKGLGQNGGIILGQANAMRNSGAGQGAGGGQSLITGAVQELINQTINVNIPPKIVEQTSPRDGVAVRMIEELGQQHSLSLLDGLPNHGALFNMSGFRLPELPNIPTAKQTNDQMMTDSMLEQLPGQLMSLGQMFQGLMKNGSGGGGGNAGSGGGLGNGQSYFQDILDALPPNMQAALNSLSLLIQSHETSGVGYVVGGAVHYGSYLESAVQLLSQVTNIDDLMNVLQQLQWDSTLSEPLDTVLVQIDNAWGVGTQKVYSNGYITVTYANANSQIHYANTYFSPNTGGGGAAVSAPASSSGGGGGSGSSSFGSIFGTASQTMQEMWKRLAMTQEQNAKQLHQDLTSNDNAQTQNQVNKTTQQGGDVTSILQQAASSFSVTTQ